MENVRTWNNEVMKIIVNSKNFDDEIFNIF
jgi:hypothetical protein